VHWYNSVIWSGCYNSRPRENTCLKWFKLRIIGFVNGCQHNVPTSQANDAARHSWKKIQIKSLELNEAQHLYNLKPLVKFKPNCRSEIYIYHYIAVQKSKEGEVMFPPGKGKTIEIENENNKGKKSSSEILYGGTLLLQKEKWVMHIYAFCTPTPLNM